jgi:hypothetical protein
MNLRGSAYVQGEKDEIEKILKEYDQKKIELEKQAFETLKSFSDSFFEKQAMNLQDAADADNAAKEKELENVNLTQAQKDAINKKYADKEKARALEKKKLDHDKAVADKAFAAMGIIINTALAIIKLTAALALTPLLIPAAVAAETALGALQLATVLATPIPKYEKGRTGGKAELAMVGEKGVEAIMYGGKGILTPDKPSLAYLPEGADVWSHDKLVNALYSNPEISNNNFANNTFNSILLAEAYSRENAKVIQAIKNKKETHFIGTERGIKAIVRSGNSTTEYINKNIAL